MNEWMNEWMNWQTVVWNMFVEYKVLLVVFETYFWFCLGDNTSLKMLQTAV